MPLAAVESRRTSARRVAALAHDALIDEIETWPKPGLVSPVDSGSHRDMDFVTLMRSAEAIRPFLIELARAGERRAEMADLRRIGLAAETAMMRATAGVNAHRGAIFSMGLICAAEGARDYVPCSAETRAKAVADLWGTAILRGPTPTISHGGRVARRYGVGGARVEAATGFPTLRTIGLPALRDGRRLRPNDPNAARVHCLFALMAALDDTNLLHRGGLDGLAFVQAEATRFLGRGGIRSLNWCEQAVETHRAFVSRNLSPGGSADLLAATLLLDALEAQ